MFWKFEIPSIKNLGTDKFLIDFEISERVYNNEIAYYVDTGNILHLKKSFYFKLSYKSICSFI